MIGIWDHSGLNITKYNYNSIDHHIHHKYPSKNFGTSYPFLIFDMLHGTYKEGDTSSTPLQLNKRYHRLNNYN